MKRSIVTRVGNAVLLVLVGLGLFVPKTAGAATARRPVPVDPSVIDSLTAKTALTAVAAESVQTSGADATDALIAGAAHPTGTAQQLFALAHQAAVRGLDDAATAYTAAAGGAVNRDVWTIATTAIRQNDVFAAERELALLGIEDAALDRALNAKETELFLRDAWNTVNTTNKVVDLFAILRQEQLVGADYPALNDAVHEKASTLWQQRFDDLLANSRDPRELREAVREAGLLGFPQDQTEPLTAKAARLEVESGSAATSLSSDPISGSPGSAAGDPWTAVNTPGTHSDPADSSSGASGNSQSLLPAGATNVERTGYTVSPSDERTTDTATGTTTSRMYVSVEYYTYTAADGAEHRLTVHHDADGNVTSTDPRCQENECPQDDGYCVEDGCGNAAPSFGGGDYIPTACRIDGCRNPLIDNSDSGITVDRIPTGCDPNANYLEGCGGREGSFVPGESWAGTSQPCAVDGCTRPDLAPELDPSRIPDTGPIS